MKTTTKNLLILAVILFIQGAGLAQPKKATPFENGEPIGLVFSNFYTGINKGNNPSAFEIRRAYLGYKFNLDEHYSAKIQLDIGSPDDVSEYSLLRRFAYFKDAYLQYKNGKFSVRFGIIPIQQFKLQESIWGHRYIAKTILDEHGLATSADLGTSIFYQATPYLEFDFTLMNGEGYSNLQTDYSYKTGFGFTLRPWKGLVVRAYADAIQKTEYLMTIVNLVGYEIEDKMSLGVEYDFKLNDGFEKNQNIDAFSAYLSYNINKKFQLFGRYDNLTSNIPYGESTPWNLSEDGSAIIGGVQYQPISKIRLALNYQDWYPHAKNLDNESYIYLNIEFKIW